MNRYLFFLLWFLPCSVFATGEYRDLSSDVWYFKSGKEVKISQVVEKSAINFTQTKTPIFVDGFSEQTYWFKVPINTKKLQLNPNSIYLLEIDFPPLSSVVVYQKKENGSWWGRQSGAKVPLNEREIDHRNHVFTLELAPGANEVFVAVESLSSIQFPVRLWEYDNFFQHHNRIDIFWGALYGALVTMFLYNLFIYVSVKERSYLYYLGYLATCTLILSTLNGYSFKVIWPYSPSWNEAAITSLACFTFFWGSFFVRNFCNLPKHFPVIDKVVVVFGLASLIPTLLSAIQLQPYNTVTACFAITFSLLLLYVGVKSVAAGVPSSKYFLIAWCSFLGGTFIYTMSMFGKVVPNDFVINAIHFGSSVEVVLLSLGLGAKMRQMRQHNIDLQQRITADLEEKNRELIKATKDKDEFLSLLSHELRTPVNGVIGNLELSHQANDKLPFLEFAKMSADQMNEKLESILEFVDIRMGKNVGAVEEFSPNELISGIVEVQKQKYQTHDFEVSVQSQFEDDELIVANRELLTVALNELIANALKFTLKGTVSVQFEVVDDDFRFSVHDTGVGIPKAQIEKVFEPFNLADNSMHRQFQGLGMGLANTKLIVEHLGGKVKLISVEGKGTSVYLSLPVEVTEESELVS